MCLITCYEQYSIITKREREGCVINNFLFPKEILEIHTLAFDTDVNMDGFNPMVIKSESIPGTQDITGEILKRDLCIIYHTEGHLLIQMQYIYSIKLNGEIFKVNKFLSEANCADFFVCAGLRTI